MKKVVSLILIIITILSCLTACGTDKQEGYHSTDMQARSFAPGEGRKNFQINTVELITDYEKYSSYHFNLDYTEEFFENNGLLVFIVYSCSSDQMKYIEICEKDGFLYPLFERKKLGENDPATRDIIMSSYYVEVSKEFGYKAGEIIYNYK